jgi:hypothetical protein
MLGAAAVLCTFGIDLVRVAGTSADARHVVELLFDRGLGLLSDGTVAE